MASNRGTSGSSGAAQLPDTQTRVDGLELKVNQLIEAMSTVAGYERMINLIDHGLSEIAGHLEPLRDLRRVPESRPLPSATVKALGGLRKSLKKPRWADVGSLAIVEDDVGFIGQAQPASRRPASDGASKVGTRS